MNDRSLRELMNRLPVPPPSEAAREKALARAQIAYVHRPDRCRAQCGSAAKTVPSPRMAAFRIKLMASVCLGALVVASVLLPHLWRGRRTSVGGGEAATWENRQDCKLLAEMEALFRGQLDAVISRGDDVSLDLAPALSMEGNPASRQPLAVILQRGKKIVRVLGFSGHRVCIQLDGRKECFEPLVDADGKVFLAGQDFVWSDENPTLLAGYRVQAHSLSL